MKISKEFKIGFLVTAALALLYWGINFLKGEDVFTNDRIFYAVYKDVAGLQKSNPVTINGLYVGRVRNMYFTRDGKASVILEMIISDDIQIPANSTAKIISSDLLGSKAVEIILGIGSALAESGDTLRAEMEVSIKEEVNRQLKPLKNKAESLMSSIDTVLTMLQGIFSTANTENFARSVTHIANSFEHLESATSNIDTLLIEQKSRLARIFEDIESITQNLHNNEAQISNVIQNLSTVSDSIAAMNFSTTMGNLSETLENLAAVTKKINAGEGSLGLLINNDSLYFELEKASKDLNLLLEDIRINPKRYVRFSVF